ncbi:MBL fold metallo-hydrolase [Verrucomicrobiota bacterium]
MNKFTIHGARGTMPISGREFLKYGGKTTCFSLETDQGVIIVDAGTGIVSLSDTLRQGPDGPPITILFMHFHLDHVIGLPVFVPLYDSQACITLMADANRVDDWQTSLQTIAGAPYWPLNLMKFGSHIQFHSLQDHGAPSQAPGCRQASGAQTDAQLKEQTGEMELYGTHISWCRVQHPQQCLAFRIKTPESCIVIATDREHGSKKLDECFLEFCRDADFLIYDAQYTPEEYPAHKGWGHGTWLEGTQLVKDAHVRELILTHHDQLRQDAEIDDMVSRARKVFPKTRGAHAGMVLTE